MTDAEKYSTLIEKIPQVNEAGKNSMLKYHPEATVSGSYISLDDVSELPHEVKCKISGVEDPTTVKVVGCGKNLAQFTEPVELKYAMRAISFPCIVDSTFVISYNVTINDMANQSAALFAFMFADGTKMYDTIQKGTGTHTKQRVVESEKTLVSVNLINYAGFNGTLNWLQVERGEVPTEYEPYNGATYTPNADGTVEGMTSVSPYMRIFTDAAGTANIEASFRKSKGMLVEREQFYDSFKQGKINHSISFEWMMGLGGSNIRLIVNGLSNKATGQTLTLPLEAVNRSFETSSGANDGSTSAAFAELVATKTNWTITLI